MLYSVNMCDLIIICKIASKASTNFNQWSIMELNRSPLTSDTDYSLCSGVDPWCAKVHVGFSYQKASSTNRTQNRDLEALTKRCCCFGFFPKSNLLMVLGCNKGPFRLLVIKLPSVSAKFIGPAGQICDQFDLPHFQPDWNVRCCFHYYVYYVYSESDRYKFGPMKWFS